VAYVASSISLAVADPTVSRNSDQLTNSPEDSFVLLPGKFIFERGSKFDELGPRIETPSSSWEYEILALASSTCLHII
jgi:hypothetical protein